MRGDIQGDEVCLPIKPLCLMGPGFLEVAEYLRANRKYQINMLCMNSFSFMY